MYGLLAGMQKLCAQVLLAIVDYLLRGRSIAKAASGQLCLEMMKLTPYPVLSIEDLLLHVLHVLVHDVDPASIFLQLKVHLLQLLLQVLHSKYKQC